MDAIINNFPFLDLIYPIGSVYFSDNNINPSTYFGGEWELLGDKLIVSGNLNVIGNGLVIPFSDGSNLGTLQYSSSAGYIGTNDSNVGKKIGTTPLTSGRAYEYNKLLGLATKEQLGDNLSNSGLIALNNGLSIYSWKRVS